MRAIVLAVSDAAGEVTRVALTLPGERRSIGIVRLFVGGLAARLGLGYETMDDFQLALESVLLKAELGPEITLEAAIEGEAVSVTIGPLARDPLQPDTAGPDELDLAPPALGARRPGRVEHPRRRLLAPPRRAGPGRHRRT